jgi:general stress protein 26
MIVQDHVVADQHRAVYDVLGAARAGMLGLAGGGDGFQPMTHFPDADLGSIWFVSSTGTDLVQSLGLGEDADYVLISDENGIYASLRGKLYHVQNDAKLNELWSPVVAAWFEGGREDPQVALLRFDPEVADVWASAKSSVSFGIKVNSANSDPKHRPDVGTKTTIRFPLAA